MGYSPSHKGYKCLVAGGRLYISKDVIFNEHNFPYPTLFPEPSLITSEVPDTTSPLTVLSSSQPAVSSHRTNNNLFLPPSSYPSSHSEQHHNTSHSQPLNESDIALPQDHSPISQYQNNSTIPQNQNPTLSPTDTVPQAPLNTHPICTRDKSSIVKPRIDPTILLAHLQPKSTKAVLVDPSWFSAMQFEPPDNRTAIRCNWVFRIRMA